MNTIPSGNTTYNVIDTLMHLDMDLWNQAEAIWSEDQEEFITRCSDLCMVRQVAYTYWWCIHFSITNKYRDKEMRTMFPLPSEGVEA